MCKKDPSLAFYLKKAQVAATQENNRAFVSSVYEGLFDDLFKIASSFSFLEAEDMVHEFFVRRLLNRKNFENFPCSNEEHLKNYIFRMIRNFCCSEFKKHFHKQTIHLSGDEMELNKIVVLPDNTGQGIDLRKRLKRLPLRQKRAFVLFHFHGYSMEEICEKLKTTLDSVRNLLHRGKMKFLAA